MKLKYLVPLIAFLALSILLGIGLTLDPRAIPSTMIGKTAPDFNLPVLSNESEYFKPSDLKGERWVLNVWASWCFSCRQEHPILNDLAAQGVAKIIGLNYKDETDKARTWIKQRGNPYYKTVVDTAGSAGIDWGVIAVPETFIIDENGHVIYKHTGPITRQLVRTEMMPLLTRAVATTGTLTQ